MVLGGKDHPPHRPPVVGADDVRALVELAQKTVADKFGIELELEIEGDALTEARAATVADFLERAGLARPRLAAIGYGPAEGVEGMDTGAAMPSDRPLRFSVRKRSGQWPG